MQGKEKVGDSDKGQGEEAERNLGFSKATVSGSRSEITLVAQIQKTDPQMNIGSGFEEALYPSSCLYPKQMN